jgi:beta-lactam-binding protein with PASTA domain
VKVKRVRSARVKRGRVIKASAKAGAKLAAGSVVTLKISRGRR